MPWFQNKRVVVPVDFSDRSLAAVKEAVSMVGDNRNVEVIHVLPVLTVTEPGVIWDTIDDQSRINHATKALKERLSLYPEIKIHVTVGDPGHEISEYAKTVDADLVVIPSHGRTGLERMLLGSVAERVLRLAPCPVMVIKEEAPK